MDILEGDDRLALTNSTGEPLVVLGYEGEPYLRFDAKGVHENVRSPAATLNDDRYARLELPADDLVRAVTEPLRGQVVQAVRAAGFRFVALDLAGIQSGAFTLSLLTRDHASGDHA